MGPDWAGFLVAGTAVATLDAADSYAIKTGAVVDTWGLGSGTGSRSGD